MKHTKPLDPDTLEPMVRLAAARLMAMARGSSPDKLDWAPAEGARTIRDVVGEPIQGLNWTTRLLRDGDMSVFSGKHMASEQAARSGWKDWDEVQGVLNQNLDDYMAAVRGLSVADYEKEFATPWGITLTPFDCVHWGLENLIYHTGQVAYIQTLYGDNDMHGWFEAEA